MLSLQSYLKSNRFTNSIMKITSRVQRAHQNIIRKFLISLALKLHQPDASTSQRLSASKYYFFLGVLY